MEEKTVTIKKINFSGKWVEFWFEEEVKIQYDPFLEKDVDTWTESCKTYMLREVIESAGIEDKILYEGYNYLIGMKLKWKDDRPTEIIKPGIIPKT